MKMFKRSVGLLAIVITCFLFVSCGGLGKLPTDDISWGQAFHVLSGTFTYWFFIVLGLIVSVLINYFGIYKKVKKDGEVGTNGILLLVIAVILFVTIIAPVSSMAAATKVENLNNGHPIR